MSEHDPVATAAMGAKRGRMTPGVALIALFLLFLTTVNVYGSLSGAFGAGPAKYGVLGLCTILVAGLYGLMKMTRWGWAIVLAGCLLLGIGDAWVYAHSYQGFFLVRAIFMLVFFLYMASPEIRDRMR